MKKAGILILFSLICQSFYAQAFTNQGDIKLQIGFIPYGYGTGLRGTYDMGVFSIFSLGAGAEVYFDEDDSNEDRNFYAFGRANAHLGEMLNLPREIDVYPGIDLGITGDGLGIGGHIGVRYFFNETLGVYVEIGSRGSFGVSINL